MTMDEFHTMPWRLGWKHEYFDGMAYLTPRHHSVATVVPVESRPLPPNPCHIRPVVPEDAQALIELYFRVFQDSVEFCNYQTKDIRRSAQRCIEDYFGANEDPFSSVSQVAISSDGVTGAALVITGDTNSPFLRLLCVDKMWQRQGIGTALVITILNELLHRNVTQLESRYLLANDVSRTWHHRFGFQDQPDLFATRLYFRHAQHELWRQEKLGKLTEDELSQLATEVEKWRRLAELQEAEWQKSLG